MRLGGYTVAGAFLLMALLASQASVADARRKIPNLEEISCETCQAISYMQSGNFAKETKSKYAGAMAVAAEGLFDTSAGPGVEICQYAALASYASTSTPVHDATDMMFVCDRMMSTLADDWVENLAAGKSEAAVRRAVCVRKGVCKAEWLWTEEQFPEQRRGTIQYNTREGAKYRVAYEKEAGVVKTASGILYKVLQAGDASRPSPLPTQKVHAKYTGWLVDGTEFDSSAAFPNGAEFPVRGVIQGWQETLQSMRIGEKRKVVIPPELGYGAQSMGGKIGPNSTLVFEMELVSVHDKPAASASAPSSPPKPEL